MKKLFACTLVAGVSLFGGVNFADAKFIKGSLAPSPVVPEVVQTEGKTLTQLEGGKLSVIVTNLPKNIDGSPLPVQLTDVSPVPALKFDVQGYEVSALKVQTVEGRWIIRNAVNLGKMKVSRNGSARMKAKRAGDLSGFNMLVVTAEQGSSGDGHRWRMSEDVARSFISGEGTSGLIILWGQIGPIE